MNFSRKTILVVGAALLAACGDKVTVQEYTPPTTTPKVNFVEVTPATATVSTGASITFTAAVNADAGLATTVTWSASAGAVTSAGVFTAPTTANPGISVCATSTVDTGKKGCATVVVSAPTATIPASISINSIQVTGAIGGATVNPAAVVGPIDVILNVNPGNQTVSKIVLLVGGQRADSQTFTAAQSAALRYAADEAVSAQTTFPQVIFSVNTAAFNATTGVPRWLNGSQGISAQLYTSQGGTATAATATAQTNLIFANPNTVTGSATVTGGNTTTDANGYTWRSGAVNANVIPVIYSAGTTVSSVIVNFGNGACDNSGAGARAKAATAPATGTYAWTASFAGGTTNSDAGNVATFELNPIGCAAAYVAGGQAVTADVVDGNGNPIAIGILVSPTARFRLDNFAPVVGGILPTSVNFFANPNGRNSNWINGSVTMTAQTATNLDGWLTNPVLDAGVGSPSAMVKVGADQATAIASTTTYTTTAAMAPTADAASQCAVLYGKDKLGNTSADPAAAACGAAGGATEILYGVDKVAPLVTGIRRPGSTSTSSTGRRTTFAGTFFRVIVSDTGIIGNSGMAIANPVRGTVKYRTATVASTCDVADPATLATTCDAATVTNNAARIGVLGGTTVGEVYVAMTPATVNGYYTAAFYSVDAAGNVSSVRTRVSSLDNVLPSVTTASLTNAAIANTGFTFTSLASDNLDLRQYLYYFGYDAVVSPTFFNVADNAPVLGTPAGMPAGYLVPTAAVTPAAVAVNPVAATVYETQTSTAIGTYNGTTLVNSNYQMIGTTTLPLVLQGTAGAFGAVTPVAYNAAAKLSSIFSYTQDQGGTGGTTINTGIAGSVLAPAASVFTTASATPATDITTFNFGAYRSATGAYDLLGVMGCSGALTRDNAVLSGCQAVLAPNTVEASSFTVRASVIGASPAGGFAGLAQPFSKVLLVAFSEFNVANNTAGAAFMQVLGTLGAPTATDNGATRTWNYTGTLTADANTWDLLGGCSSNTSVYCGAGSSLYIVRNVYALGIDANGRVALVSQPIALTIKE